MKSALILIITFLSVSFSLAQEADSLESLSLPPEESAAASTQKSGFSIPEGASTSGIGKSHGLGGVKGAKTKENVGAILDFEGEVIEGERRRPDLFLQISIDNIKFDSLIYNRDDFNDYLEVDRKSRTRFLKMK